MMEKLQDGIYRICIPFENIYTSAFVLTEGDCAIVLDSGNSEEDAERYIIPELEKLQAVVKYLVSTHTHQDHYGGTEALKKAYPEATLALFSKEKDAYYLTDGEVLLGRFKMLNLKGHSEDSLAVLDTKTDTLLSGDSLQGYGVGRYRTLVSDFDEYLKSVERVRELNPKLIIASHEYEPSGSIVKDENTDVFLQICIDAVNEKECR